MIICPSCHHKNIPGAVFCSECGTALIQESATDTRQIKKTREIESDLKVEPERIRGWVTLHILSSGQLLPLSERSEFTLGRLSDGQPIVPDVDLSPFQAYSLGVSRLHAMLRRGDGGRVFVMDMGSSNGTYLNGRRLNPREPVMVAHGDVVSLGKLKIQILLA